MLLAGLPVSRLMAALLAVMTILVLAGVASNTDHRWTESPDVAVDDVATTSNEPIEAAQRDAAAEVAFPSDSPLPGWVALVVFGAILGVLLYLAVEHLPKVSLPRLTRYRLASSAASDPPDDAIHEEDIIRVATDVIDELSFEGDPRVAIQRAYAAVETGFGSRQFARKPAETPLRYLERVFGRDLERAAPLQELTALFERARFSTQPITEAMRAQAIASVTEIRTHYRSRRPGHVR